MELQRGIRLGVAIVCGSLLAVRSDDKDTVMRLNPPGLIIFLISVTLAGLALVTKLGLIPIPRYVPHQEFWLAITAYMTLMIGNIARGL